MAVRNPLKYLVPSVDELLNSQLRVDALNIEDDLSTPDDQDAFLKASMAFLQQHLKRKLGRCELLGTERSYSDMLLFERDCDSRFYIRLKNSEKFDEIKRSETSIPDTVLSREQILPVAKKPKLCISKLFHIKSSPSLKESKFNLFKKHPRTSHFRHQLVSSINIGATSNISLESSIASVPKNVPSVTTLFESANEWQDKIKVKCKHNNDKQKIIKLIPSVSDVSCSELSAYSESVSVYSKAKHRHRLREQQSKLSVCVEDDLESDYESSNNFSNMSCNNLPDELKLNVCPEDLQKIISQMILYLEQTPVFK